MNDRGNANTPLPFSRFCDVRGMFSSISGDYDRLNRILSLGLDRGWRKRLARRLHELLKRKDLSDPRVLDVCCGTGALSRLCVDAIKENAQFCGLDFSYPMMAKSKLRKAPSSDCFDFVQADALGMPFADASFDMAICAFGLRNLTNRKAGLDEMLRVLRPGGHVLLLEFSQPSQPLLHKCFEWYLSGVLSRLGNWMSQSHAYDYLSHTVQDFARPAEVAGWLRDRGFENVQWQCLTFGAVVLYEGSRRIPARETKNAMQNKVAEKNENNAKDALATV